MAWRKEWSHLVTVDTLGKLDIPEEVVDVKVDTTTCVELDRDDVASEVGVRLVCAIEVEAAGADGEGCIVLCDPGTPDTLK